jgi:hypothetical protein
VVLVVLVDAVLVVLVDAVLVVPVGVVPAVRAVVDLVDPAAEDVVPAGAVPAVATRPRTCTRT